MNFTVGIYQGRASMLSELLSIDFAAIQKLRASGRDRRRLKLIESRHLKLTKMLCNETKKLNKCLSKIKGVK